MSPVSVSLLILIIAIGSFMTTGHIRQAFARDDAPLGEEEKYIGKRYAPYVHPMLLVSAGPLIVLLSLVMARWLHMPGFGVNALFWFLSVMFQIGIYHMLLLALTPVLRKRISPRGITVLWILPNSLYLTYHFRLYIMPSVMIFMNERAGFVIFAVWAAGALVTMTWYCVSHLRFRNAILSGAANLSSEAEAVLREEEKRIGIDKPFRAVVSDRVRTPLSVGLFKKTKCIVLPVREYTERELSFIFRHELIHLRREDCAAKMYLCLSASVFWWNPLLKIAMRKNAEDMELACDQMALAEADDAARKEYAELLLTTSGDHRGFTTCLSATAESLYYRLRAVLHPVKKSDGIAAAAVLLVLLFLTCGQVGVVFHKTTAAGAIEAVSSGAFDRFDHVIGSFTENPSPPAVKLDAGSREVLFDFLRGLEVYELTGYGRYAEANGINFDMWSQKDMSPDTVPDKDVTISFYRHCMWVGSWNGGEQRTYYIYDYDREALSRLLQQ